ncbi:MAG: acyl-CoA synthetase [Betaproteobacteria bacterium]|nr:acyl-CoA synthetase [Betaproteobacteria bacterium]
MNAKASFPPFPAWTWQVPQFFNIGVACTDAHLGTEVESRIAMIVEDDTLGTQRATYAELAQRTAQFAQLLRKHKVEPGERVLIRLPNSLDYPTAFLGTMKAGCIAVPTSTLLTPEEVLYLIKDSGAAVLVMDGATWEALASRIHEAPQAKLVLLAGKFKHVEGAPLPAVELTPALNGITAFSAPHATHANDPAYLVYTSGTTGYPKGVLHAHRALIGREPASEYWFNFDANQVDRILHSGKFNWTYVLGSGLMDPLYRGKTVIVHEGKNDANLWMRLIAKHRATIFIGVPTIYRQIVQKTESTRADVPSLRFCMSAGEHLSDDMLTAWRERFGMDIFEAVGMSEFSYYLSQSIHRPIRAGSAGFAQPGHDIRLLNPETLEPVPHGEEGMISVPESDPGLFLKYWNQPEETAKYKHDGYFFTGDYAKIDDEGYLWFLGRKDDIIKSFGYRVSPYEVERVLKSNPAVADCACIAEEIEKDKLIVAAYVIAQPGAPITANELLKFGQQQLAAYKAPKRVYLAKEFPRTKNGKILRREISPKIAVSASA